MIGKSQGGHRRRRFSLAGATASGGDETLEECFSANAGSELHATNPARETGGGTEVVLENRSSSYRRRGGGDFSGKMKDRLNLHSGVPPKLDGGDIAGGGGERSAERPTQGAT